MTSSPPKGSRFTKPVVSAARLFKGQPRGVGRWLAGCVSCAILAASGFGWVLVDHVNGGIDRVDAFSRGTDRPRNDEGLNFLLVGVDGREGLSKADRHRLHTGGASCNCTDTIMILHISRDRERASVVSIPRDSYVEFPAHVEPAPGTQEMTAAHAAMPALARANQSAEPASAASGQVTDSTRPTGSAAGSPSASPTADPDGPRPSGTVPPVADPDASSSSPGTVTSTSETAPASEIAPAPEEPAMPESATDTPDGLPPTGDAATPDTPAGSAPPSGDPAATEPAHTVHHFGKINAAYAHGGPALTVSTVEKATGIHIDHYLEVDFHSFMGTVDALGGIEVCSMIPLDDRYSGLNLPRGTSTLDGAAALKYVRARHIGAGSDFSRIHRQQHFLTQIIRRLRGSGTLMNPGRLSTVVHTVLSSIRADEGLSSGDVVALGSAMRHLTPSGAEFAQVPVADADYRGDPDWGSSVLWNRAKAAALFAKLRDDRPIAEHRPKGKGKEVPIDPRGIRVQLFNGTSRSGLGAEADEALAKAGFATTGEPRDATRADLAHTRITYDPRWDRSAASLATALPGAELVAAPGHGPVMDVTLGADYQGVTKVHAATSGLTEAPDGAVTGDQVLCP